MSQKAKNKEIRDAIGFRDHQSLKKLISSCDNINAIIDGSDSILHYATRQGYLEMVETIINKYPNINIVNDQGQTPLHCLTNERPRQIGDCRAMNYKGFYIEYDGDFNRDIAELLIANGADINALDKNGNSPLHYAMQNKISKAALLLFSAGSDLYLKNKDKKTPLDIATMCLEADKVEFCVSHKRFRLHLAATSGSTGHVIQSLLDTGFSPNEQTSSGHSPLHYALGWYCNFSGSSSLIDAGANVDIQDVDGDTPLHMAAENGYSSIVKLLLDCNANRLIKNHKSLIPVDVAKTKLLELDKDDLMFDGLKGTIRLLEG